jgi:cyclase
MQYLITVVIVLLLALSNNSIAQDDQPTINVTEVSPGLYMLAGGSVFIGGNMGLLTGDDGVVLIDDGLEPYGALLLGTIGDITGDPVDYVINTHVHGDHVGSNAAYADTGAVIFAHDNIRKRLLDDPTLSGGPGGLPHITFSDQVTFHVNGTEAFVFHVEHAHTDGDAVIEFRGPNVIHAGDVHFNYLFPFIDLDNGGSVAGFLAAQRRMLNMADDDTIIIPGHGPLASKADLQKAIEVLVDCEARVKALVDAGKTEAEILADNPLADYHDTWNWGFITTERMTQTLYRSLTSE